MKFTKTQRGFDYAEFVDAYGVQCSIQKSSLASEDAIWLGTEKDRMHLTQDMVKQLLPYLVNFAETGELI